MNRIDTPFQTIPTLEEWLEANDREWSPEAEADYWDWREEEAREV